MRKHLFPSKVVEPFSFAFHLLIFAQCDLGILTTKLLLIVFPIKTWDIIESALYILKPICKFLH